MCPLSDDALLDWALAPGEADPAIERHLRECASCRSRSEAVRREQALLRNAFVEPKPSLRLEERLAPRPQGPLWARLGIAALLLMAITVGVLLTRTAGHPLHRRSHFAHGALAPIQSDLGTVAQKIAAARETLPEREDQQSASAYLELISREEGLVLEGMEVYLSDRSPLTETQEQELQNAVREFYATLWHPENLGAASSGFREKVRTFLNAEQMVAFEEFSRQGLEWQRRTDITLLMEDLAEEFDLRFSEAEKVRAALESNYPRADLPLPRVDRCPPDPLVDNPTLSGAVRNSLDARYRGKFDTYLGQVVTARERAFKIVRQARTSR
jgi:hypothetical protein